MGRVSTKENKNIYQIKRDDYYSERQERNQHTFNKKVKSERIKF